MIARAGFLWDALSANLGDQAIGVHLMRWAERAGLPAVAIDPAATRAAQLPVLVIGGGELLHPNGHPYYDVFRVPGRHILNAVGTFGTIDGAHLEAFRLVSVRSAEDRAAITGVTREITVVPCTAVCYSDLARDTASPHSPAGSVGLHVHAGSFGGSSAFESVLAVRAALGPRVALFSFTPYNGDLDIARVCAEIAGYPPPQVFASPDEAFAFIARLDAVVVSSLHAMIFAYQAGVPFLVLGYSPKIERFARERGLGERVIHGLSELSGKRALLDRDTVGWDAALAADRAAIARHLDTIGGLIEQALAEPPSVAKGGVKGPDPLHVRASHALMLDRHGAHGRMVAKELRWTWRYDEIQRHVRRLEEELEALRRPRTMPASRAAASVGLLVTWCGNLVRRLFLHAARLVGRLRS
jgi:hypothetical protein